MIGGLALVLLTFAVVVVALAQLHLYRLVRATNPNSDWSNEQWPLHNLNAGEVLAAEIVEPVGDQWVGLLLICSDDRDEYGVVASVASVAVEWNLELLLALRESGDATGWEARLAPDVNRRSFVMRAGDFDTLGCRGTPVLLAVDRGRVLDATQDLVAPSTIAQRLRYVAAQLTRPIALTPDTINDELRSAL